MRTNIRISAWGAAAGFLLSLAVLPLPAAQTREQSFPTHRFGRLEKADELIGSDIKNNQGQTLGKIDDLVVDLESGHVLFAVASADGNQVAVAPESFSAGHGAKSFTLDADKQKLAGAPQFKKDQLTEMANASFLNTVYQYWNQKPWWEGAAQPTGRTSFGNVHKLSELKGLEIKNVSNQDIGKVDNAAIDLPAGRIPFILLAPGGTLQAQGDFVYVLPANALTMGTDQKTLTTDLDQNRLAGAPKVNRNNWQALSNPEFAAQVYQFYGKQAYFESGAPIGHTGRTNAFSRDFRGGKAEGAAGGFGQIEPARRLIGREIQTQQNQRLGKLDDVVVDLESGRVLYTVVSVDGNKVGVPPELFSESALNKPLTVNADRQKLAGAPHFTGDIANNLAGANFASDVYHYFNQPAWWEGAGQATGRGFGNVHKASELTGMAVKDSANENLGKINDVIVDLTNGRIPYFILSTGGTLGANQALYAIPPNAFTPGQDQKTLVTGVDRQKLQSAPRLAKNEWQKLSDPSYAAQIYEFYGKQPYWTTPTGRSTSGTTP